MVEVGGQRCTRARTGRGDERKGFLRATESSGTGKLNNYLFMESPENLKNSKNVNFEHFSPRSSRNTQLRTKSARQKFAFVTL
jgi:hypothetical protein